MPRLQKCIPSPSKTIKWRKVNFPGRATLPLLPSPSLERSQSWTLGHVRVDLQSLGVVRPRTVVFLRAASDSVIATLRSTRLIQLLLTCTPTYRNHARNSQQEHRPRVDFISLGTHNVRYNHWIQSSQSSSQWHAIDTRLTFLHLMTRWPWPRPWSLTCCTRYNQCH